ncbi:MAG TPA: cohesin domain-containing protein [Patescibacteria group bacterium]|nr:cohesin domain-containing protein [Patescibacteria group bacterium]
MPRKTLFLLVGLIILTVILIVIAVQVGSNQQTQQTAIKTTGVTVSPTPDVAHTTLMMSPNPIQVATGRTGSVDVIIDPSDNEVTAVQLELLYDPSMVSNVKVVPGPLFPNAAVLLNKNNATEGTYTYAYGIQPGQKAVTAKGVAATVTFTARGTLGKQSQIILQPNTLVTARAVANSVLKEGIGTTVVISSQANATEVRTTVTTTPVVVTAAPAQ